MSEGRGIEELGSEIGEKIKQPPSKTRRHGQQCGDYQRERDRSRKERGKGASGDGKRLDWAMHTQCDTQTMCIITELCT